MKTVKKGGAKKRREERRKKSSNFPSFSYLGAFGDLNFPGKLMHYAFRRRLSAFEPIIKTVFVLAGGAKNEKLIYIM